MGLHGNCSPHNNCVLCGMLSVSNVEFRGEGGSLALQWDVPSQLSMALCFSSLAHPCMLGLIRGPEPLSETMTIVLTIILYPLHMWEHNELSLYIIYVSYVHLPT